MYSTRAQEEDSFPLPYYALLGSQAYLLPCMNYDLQQLFIWPAWAPILASGKALGRWSFLRPVGLTTSKQPAARARAWLSLGLSVCSFHRHL